jgi:hypothetical protein
MSGHLRLLRPTDAPSGWARRTDGGLTPWLVIESVERAPEIGYLMGRGMLIWQLRKASLRLRVDTDTRGRIVRCAHWVPERDGNGLPVALDPSEVHAAILVRLRDLDVNRLPVAA